MDVKCFQGFGRQVSKTTDRATLATTTLRGAPGGALLHPVSLAAIAVLVVNDHILKASHPGWWTGKLSDVAGLVFFPLLAHAAWEYVVAWSGRSRDGSRRVLIGCIVVTALGFCAIQLWGPAADAYRAGLAGLQWPYHALIALITGDAIPPIGRVHLTQDPTDILATPAVGIAAWLGWNRQ